MSVHTASNFGREQDNLGSTKEGALRLGLEGSGIAGVLAQLGREHLAKDVTSSQKEAMVIKSFWKEKKGNGFPHKVKIIEL